MTSNQLMTGAAVAFAAFALWQFNKARPAASAVSNQPGQQQRDAALVAWNAQQATQWDVISQQLSRERFFF